MKQGLLSWSPCPHSLFLPTLYPIPFPMTHLTIPTKPIFPIKSALESASETSLTARERRQMRNERRESKPTYNWKEEVEERLIKKPKKKYKSWTEDLNLDYLALLGPQWWVVRVSRVSGHETAERLARALIRNYPEVEFKVYAPAVQVKRILKNGSISVKPKPLFPGCVFLRCVMNKEIHDFIRECEGVGGFIGSKVGNTKKQINKPRPVSSDDMEAIFRQAKEEQKKTDEAFEEEQQGEGTDIKANAASKDVAGTSKLKRRSRKASKTPLGVQPTGKDDKLLLPGSTVQATVGFTLFGKETLADLDVSEIVAETE
ncbi:hypothetical protein RJ639_036057 [Escallonia herrerae]|uniref:NusG-like N-terminal domain-containing protein n=1 Tax=Escallonia herrerae TaxID=1293975 RepID=A0AA89B6C7_9ASTE|nr:hypothetical protein RJ639_036057 [Escallonia herrerae]